MSEVDRIRLARDFPPTVMVGLLSSGEWSDTRRQSSSVVEQRTHKPLVAGSTPASGTTPGEACDSALPLAEW